VWAFLFILALTALAGLHFWWRGKFRAQTEHLAAEIDSFKRRQQQTSIDAQAQQKVLFDSMLEGLLLLDRSRKIYLANRTFKNLFGVKAELRGKTVVEALRLHELDELLQRAETEKQVLDYEIKLPGLTDRWLQVHAASITNKPESVFLRCETHTTDSTCTGCTAKTAATAHAQHGHRGAQGPRGAD
jgi:PAS domain S-box-containing protein